jgi:hypothetical protein
MEGWEAKSGQSGLQSESRLRGLDRKLTGRMLVRGMAGLCFDSLVVSTW